MTQPSWAGGGAWLARDGRRNGEYARHYVVNGEALCGKQRTTKTTWVVRTGFRNCKRCTKQREALVR